MKKILLWAAAALVAAFVLAANSVSDARIAAYIGARECENLTRILAKTPKSLDVESVSSIARLMPKDEASEYIRDSFEKKGSPSKPYLDPKPYVDLVIRPDTKSHEIASRIKYTSISSFGRRAGESVCLYFQMTEDGRLELDGVSFNGRDYEAIEMPTHRLSLSPSPESRFGAAFSILANFFNEHYELKSF